MLQLRDIHLSFGSAPLLDGVNLRIDDADRVCLVGRNGSGKSTLLKVIAGQIQPDEGSMERGQGVRVAAMEQDLPARLEGTVFGALVEGLGPERALLQRFHDVSHQVEEDPSETNLADLAECQAELDAAGAWDQHTAVEATLSQLELDGDASLDSLSGGRLRRVLLGRALVSQPDLLLLDEPTNHLDIETIAWLESFLAGYRGALLFITHDRAFLRRLASRIVELDRGRLAEWPGDYDEYLKRKAEALEVEARANALFDKKLKEEEVWIRQGIKARRTRNEGRVRALKQLRRERAARREQQGKAKIAVQTGERSGKRVVEATSISFAYPDKAIAHEFSTFIQRGDRVGLIGPNGSGKTTLLRLLLGDLAPQSGSVRLGTNLDVAYFDQRRAVLDLEKTVVDNVGEGNDMVPLAGKPRHVISYLKDFLFDPERARQPAKSLSGGERNRLLLAKLFARPANVLVLDEPTNDLDVETLELLEELLCEFDGTVLLVSHDREFLDAVVTSTLVMEGNGRIGEYVGGYQDWVRQRDAQAVTPERTEQSTSGKSPPAPSRKAAGGLKYSEKIELEKLPARIEALEKRAAALAETMSLPNFYQQDKRTITSTQEEAEAVGVELEAVYARWEELEEKAGRS